MTAAEHKMKVTSSAVPIRSLVQSIETWNPLRVDNDESFDYVDLSSVDAGSKTITAARNIACSEAPSRARQLVAAKDVLVSTVRPNLNGVASVPEELDGATASTGFCVLRGNAAKLDNRYLYHWVTSAGFVSSMVMLATGASYPAVSDRIILNSEIPLPHKNGKPDLDEQKRIAAILDKADAIRRKRQQALRLTDDFLRSVFLDMFGDPEGNGWETKTIEDVLLPRKGAIRTGPFGSNLLHSEFVDEGIAVLGIDNAVQNKFAPGKPRFITEEKYQSLKHYTVHPGDVLITIMGTCGRCAIVPDDIPTAINTKHLCCISLDRKKCLPEFLHSYFLLHPMAKSYLGQTAKGAIMDGLSGGVIKRMPIPEVPMSLQKQYAKLVKSRTALVDRLTNQLAESENLFSSLQQRAFRGEL